MVPVFIDLLSLYDHSFLDRAVAFKLELHREIRGPSIAILSIVLTLTSGAR